MNKVGDIVKCVYNDEVSKATWVKYPLNGEYYIIQEPNENFRYTDDHIAIMLSDGIVYHFTCYMFVNVSLVREEKINKILKNEEL